MKRILIIGLIVLLVLPFTFATEYIGNLNSDGEYYIKDNSPSEATPPTSSASSGGGGGGGPLITKEILTPETNESTIVNSVSNSQTSSKGGGNSLNDPKIIYGFLINPPWFPGFIPIFSLSISLDFGYP